MAELSFARQFLTSLDALPTRLQASHVEDPKNLPARNAPVLSKMPKSLSRKQDSSSTATDKQQTVSVTVKSLRSPKVDVTIASQPQSMTVLEIKALVSEEANIAIDRLRLLVKKRIIGDSAMLSDLIQPGEKSLEMSLMIMGAAEKDKVKTPPNVPNKIGQEEGLVTTSEFWTDLRGFLTQRLKNEQEAERLYRIFEKAYQLESKK